MKKIQFALTLTLVCATILTISCSNKTELYGEKISRGASLTKIDILLANPENFVNQLIRLEGEIGEVCPAGCWFYLKDDSGEIFVDIGAYGLAIPKKTGRKAVVEGEYVNRDEQWEFQGKGIEIK